MGATPTRGQQRSEPDVNQPRRLPAGADVLPHGGVHFHVWASMRYRVEVVLEGGPGHRRGAAPVVVALEPEGTGYFSGLVTDAAAGTLYRYRLDGEAALCADPADSETFTRSKLDLSERQYHVGMYALHRDLLRLRREEPVFWAQRHGGLDGAVLGPEALVLRFFGTAGDDRLLVVNLGRDLSLRPAPEPLLAPPKGMAWGMRWSSEDPRYDGGGTAPLEGEDGWQIPGHAAVVLRPVPREAHEER